MHGASRVGFFDFVRSLLPKSSPGAGSPKDTTVPAPKPLSLHDACATGNFENIPAKTLAGVFKKSGWFGRGEAAYDQIPVEKRRNLELHKTIFDACLEHGDLESCVEVTWRLKEIKGGEEQIG